MNDFLVFRAWDRWNKKMIMPHDGDFIRWHAMSNWRDCLAVMQWTGLCDRMGVRIFVGDVVRVDYSDGDPANYEVIFDPDRAQFRFAFLPREIRGANSLLSAEFSKLQIEMQMIIVGNIYDNPELVIQ